MTSNLWDDQARTMQDAERAVWAEDDQAAGVDHCLTMLSPLIDRLYRAREPGVLDLGAGIGRLAIPIAQRFSAGTVWALDVSERMLGHLEDCCVDQGVSNVQAVLGDGDAIPDRVPHVDAAYSVVTLQHLDRPTQAGYIAAVAARLHVGGMFRFQVVTDTEPGPLSNPVTPLQITSWCDAAGLTCEIERDSSYPTWLWVTAVRR